MVDQHLFWRAHIDYICIKVSEAIGILHKIINYLDTKALKRLHHSQMYPYLIYCNEVWGLAYASKKSLIPLHWRHNGCDSVSNHQPHDCLFNCLFRHRSKKTSKLHVTGLCVGNSPATGEFPAQMASNAKHVSIWWRHHAYCKKLLGSSVILIKYCILVLHSLTLGYWYWIT